MGRAEKFLERQVERARQLAALEEAERPPRKVHTNLQEVALRDAYETFRQQLGVILRGCEESPTEKDHFEIHPATDRSDFGESTLSSVPLAYFTATVVGSSQLGKTSMLNALLNLFGYDQPHGRVFPDVDLLPTYAKNQSGLPFPVRIEYHDCFQLRATRWSAQELEDVMQIVANRTLKRNPDFFDQLEFHEFEENSFMQFVCEHSQVDGEGNFLCESRASTTLQADGGEEEKDFPEGTSSDQSLSATIKDVHEHLLSILKQQWFRYKVVTLRCPSRLLKEMGVDSCNSLPPCILDLPGVGIVHDDNTLVEELVRRSVATADTIIVLTGQRSFTQDVIDLLRASVFRRLLDPAVTPPPTVAVTNSHVLLGLQNTEMETWREQILHGNMGWYAELTAFAGENFSSRRQHRLLSEIEPSLFPNDLNGFLNGGTEAQDVGVATLVGYFMRLPQEVYLACVSDVLERANAYRSTVDELWQAPMLARKPAKSLRLFKQALAHRRQVYEMTLSSKLTSAMQRKMFDWEHPRSLNQQMDQIDNLTESELKRLHSKFSGLLTESDSSRFQQEISSLIKLLLLEIAADWDNLTGKVVFERFLSAAQELSVELFAEWVPQLFDEARSADSDPKTENAKRALLNALKAQVPNVISSSSIQYTFTGPYRQLVWNLDVKEVLNTPRFRKGKFVGVAESKVWSDIEALVRKKIATLQEHVEKNARQQSTAVKQLVSRSRVLITETFEKCVENYQTVTSALECIAQGEGSLNQNPIVTLHKELLHFISQLTGYLEKYKHMRDHFGGEELKRILRARHGLQTSDSTQQISDTGALKKARCDI